jgi:hypothetical protein
MIPRIVHRSGSDAREAGSAHISAHIILFLWIERKRVEYRIVEIKIGENMGVCRLPDHLEARASNRLEVLRPRITQAPGER